MNADFDYDYISDAGHGWVKVPMSDIRALNIERLISPFSLLRHDWQFAYLEHTVDAAVFSDHFRRRFGRDPITRKCEPTFYSYINFLPSFPAVDQDRLYNPGFVAVSEEEALLLAERVARAHGETNSHGEEETK
jgi:hypothetical protein